MDAGGTAPPGRHHDPVVGASAGAAARAGSPVVLEDRAVDASKKRRRPSGEPPPLPRSLQRSGKILLAEAGLVLVVLVLAALLGTLSAQLQRADEAVLQWISGWRSPAVTTMARAVNDLSSAWTIAILRWGTVLTLLAFRRFRHLLVWLGSILAVGWVTTTVALVVVRARPVGLTILDHWQGSSIPSRPIAALAVTTIGITYSLIVPGRPRSVAKLVLRVLLLAVVLARLYLAVDHPFDILMGAVLGISIPVIAFRLLTPNEIFPVAYRRGRSAHLDVSGARGQAIRGALEQQLGISIADMKPFGLAGSGGSTPLRLRLAGEPGGYLFAKLYAVNHLRADRWYKVGRALLYGRLEDEASFSTVRRLVQYEDYMLRVLRDAGLPTPEPHGFVEITPEREYLIVTDFIDGARELLDAEIDDSCIDSALCIVRDMWDAGIAHRDIKPSNILVRGDQVFLIDVAFGEVRPSPWREAVDLANMMLVLAFRTSPERVYARALKFFSSADIGEAFAATHSVTMPSQSRNLLRRAREDLVARFRELAPRRQPISIQRWSLRRVMLTAGVCLVAVLAVQMVVGNLAGAGLLGAPEATQASYATVVRTPECHGLGGDPQLALEAQSVPTAALVPCVDTMPAGWSFGAVSVQDGRTELFLDSDRAGGHAGDVLLTRDCNTSGAKETPSDFGTRRFDLIDMRNGRLSGSTYYTFPGGCITYRFDFSGDGRSQLANEVQVAVRFESRSAIDRRWHEATGLRLSAP